MKMKVSNYISQYLVDHGIHTNFTVTGGGAMHLNDALGHQEGMTNIYNNHEQACAIAAEAYSRVKGEVPCVCVTSGPGGTNAITGVMGAWVDSIPMLVLSGQVKREKTIQFCPEVPLRQLGDQEFDIVHTVSNMTKYCTMIWESNEISYHLEKALFLCKEGKGGPVWLDIPLDIQGASIETNDLKHFDAKAEGYGEPAVFSSQDAIRLLDMIRNAKSPLLLAGSAIRYSGAESAFLQLVETLHIPVVDAWAANDVLTEEFPEFIGIPGSVGTRAANFALQQCDLFLSLGSRLNVRMVGYNYGDFAKNAYKVIVDIDEAELHKPTITPNWGVCADVRQVIDALNEQNYVRPVSHDLWLHWCQNLKMKYPVVLQSYHDHARDINPYVFTHYLYEALDYQDIIACSNGSACVVPIQVSEMKQGQRLICNSGCAAMGYGLPAALGASVAYPNHRVICLDGDGSIMMNIQELPTLELYHMNVKIFIFNNNGYHSIRQTQVNNFGLPLVGINRESGVAIPDFSKVVPAMGLHYFALTKEIDAERIIKEVLASDGPAFCEVFVDSEQAFAPKSSSKIMEDGSIVSPSIDEMAPFLSEEEYVEEVKSWKKISV